MRELVYSKIKIIYNIKKRDVKDPRLWSVQRQDGQAFQQSLYELSLFNEQRNDVMKKFLNEPIQSTLLGFSKVTNIFRDVLKPHDNHQNSNTALSHNSKHTDSMSRSNLKNEKYKNDRENKFNQNGDDISNLMDSMSADNIHSSNNDGFEMVTKVDLGPMPSVNRGISVNKVNFEFDKEGKVLNVDKLKSMIFRGVNYLKIKICLFILFQPKI